jgi:ubiquinone biosynthesis protein UbiJ
MIDQLVNNLLGLAEAGGNRALALDPRSIERCSEMQGQIIAIELTDLERSIYCHPGSWGLRLSLEPPAREADAFIRGKVMALASLAMSQDKLSTSMEQRIEISGQASVAQKFQSLLQQLDIDWEEQLSHLLGDVMAYRVGQGIRGTHHWLKTSVESLSLAGRDYLQEETRHLPTPVEFNRFKQETTETRQAVERLEALINHRFGTAKTE